MSFCYSFRKEGFPLGTWQEKIDELVVGEEPEDVPEGAWRELLLSSVLRQSEEDGDNFEALFLTEGSIRGVAVIEDDEEVEIKLATFASYSDQLLAARLAWEALQLGATVAKEGDGPIEAEGLDTKAVEAIHREWFSISKRSSSGLGSVTLPIFNFLSVSLESGDIEQDEDALERSLVDRVASLADAFPSSRLTVGVPGGADRVAAILQPSMRTLITKDVEAVACGGALYPIEPFIEALGDQACDGQGCWVVPGQSDIDASVWQALAGHELAADGSESGQSGSGEPGSGEPGDDEWNQIAKGPVLAFLLVAAADGTIDKKEVAGFGKVLAALEQQQEHEGVARMMRMARENIDEILPEIMSGEVDPAEMIQSFAALVDRCFGTEEGMLMKASLLYVAKQVAEASGGFLGFGSKISKDEKKALAALVHLLGLHEGS